MKKISKEGERRGDMDNGHWALQWERKVYNERERRGKGRVDKGRERYEKKEKGDGRGGVDKG